MEKKNMIDWWKYVVLDNYANFKGRASRPEYWYFYLFNFIIGIFYYVSVVIESYSDSSADSYATIQGISSVIAFIYGAYSFLTLLPSLAVSVRRLHDVNKSGWFLLIILIPIIGYFILLYYFIKDSDPGTNEYGINPKGTEYEIAEIGKD